MLKILSAKQVKDLDAYTIEHGPITSIDLMERACRGFVNWFIDHFHDQLKVSVVCGPGNNGGDGLGIARMLKERGYQVDAWVIRGGGNPTPDFDSNLDRALKTKVDVFEVTGETYPKENLFRQCDVLIDALFGSGLNRPLGGLYERVITCINTADAKRVSVDMPSGLMADSHSTGPCVRAHFTISFQLPKLSFFLPESFSFVGDWQLVDIGLHKAFIKQAEVTNFYIPPKGPRKILKKRSRFDHKGTYGHALLIAGASGKMGAAILSSRAAIRSGLGLLTTHVPSGGNVILQTAVPEAMASLDPHEEYFSSPPVLASYNVVGIGPGLGKSPDTVKAFKGVMETFGKPMVIDADGLNILSENRELLHLVPGGSVLTPHPKEFERLVGSWQNDFERLEKQKDLARSLNAYVIVKGAFSTIATPDGRLFFNSSGNPGMATGGSGDVLTGILTGLMAQGYPALEACQLGVYLHGLAGDLAAAQTGMHSLIASDLIDFLPAAFLRLRRD